MRGEGVLGSPLYLNCITLLLSTSTFGDVCNYYRQYTSKYVQLLKFERLKMCETIVECMTRDMFKGRWVHCCINLY